MPKVEYGFTPFTYRTGEPVDTRALAEYVNQNLRKLTLALPGAVVHDYGVRTTDTTITPQRFDLAVVTLGANLTLTLDGYNRPGQSCTVIVQQDGTGGRVVTWGNVEWNAGVTPTLLTTADTSYVFQFITTPDGLWHGTVNDAPDSVTSLQLKDGAVVSGKIAADAVTELALADQSVTNAKIAVAAIQGDVIAAGAITETKIADDAVTTPKLVAGAVVAGKIAAGAVVTEKLDALAVTAEKIAADAVTAAKILAGAVTTIKLDAGAVTAEKITAGTITATEIASNAITTAKLNAGAVTADKVSIATLAEVSDDAGIIVAGKLQNASGTNFLDLDASGTDPFLQHTALSLNADGSADFAGTVSADTFTATDAVFTGNIYPDEVRWSDGVSLPARISSVDGKSITVSSTPFALGVSGDVSLVGSNEVRLEAGQITTDASVVVSEAGTVAITGTLTNNGTAVQLAQPAQTVFGERDDPESALANLIAALVNLGFIVDNTTAT